MDVSTTGSRLLLGTAGVEVTCSVLSLLLLLLLLLAAEEALDSATLLLVPLITVSSSSNSKPRTHRFPCIFSIVLWEELY